MRGLGRALLLSLVVLGATAASSVAASASVTGQTAGVTFQLVPLKKCTPPEVVLGAACAVTSGLVSQDAWTVNASSATWNVPGQWRISYEWKVPEAIPSRGATMMLKMTATELIGGANNRICPGIGATAGFDLGAPQPVAVGFCAEAGGTKGDARTIKLVPSSAAGAGETAYLVVGLQDGPRFTYQYRSVVATTNPGTKKCRKPTAVGASSSAAGSCTPGQTFANNCTARIGPDDREYRIFLGLDDPIKPDFVAWLKPTLNGYIGRVPAYPGVTSKPKNFPGESALGLGTHSDNLLDPDSDIRRLFGHSEPPDELVKGGNVFVTVTQQYQQRLAAKVVAGAGNLSPADLILLALQVTDGSYPLAVLTVHNLLKNLAVKAREAVGLAGKAFGTPKYPQRCAEALLALQNANAVVSKLESLRQNPAAKADKMGPWYHAFAVLAIGALTNSDGALLAQQAEQQNKRSGLFGGEAPYDPEKNNLDFCWVQVTAKPDVDALARSVFPSAFPRSLEACLALFGAR